MKTQKTLKIIFMVLIIAVPLFVFAQTVVQDSIKLNAGWNLISVTPPMVGKSLSQMDNANQPCGTGNPGSRK